jgi:hypothetical protein
MAYRRTLCALVLSAAVMAGYSEAHARTPGDPKGKKLGHCFLQQNIAAPQVNAATGNTTTLRAAEGKVVSRVSLKQGNNCYFSPEGVAGSWTQSVNGTPCYKVDGIGTATATVTRIGSGRYCGGLGTVQVLSGTPAPTGDNGGSTGGDTGGDTGGNTPPPPPPPALGSIVVCSNATSASAGLAFGISISTRYQEIAVLEVPANGCTESMSVEEGWYIVSQGMPEGFAISDITTDPAGRIQAVDPISGMAMALVMNGSRTTMTFTNAAQ